MLFSQQKGVKNTNMLSSDNLIFSPKAQSPKNSKDDKRLLDFDYASLLNNSTTTGSRASADRPSDREEKKRTSPIQQSKNVKQEVI
jgi:hypothetical protein